MAERRMFAKTIIDSDAFLDMPMSARLLYYDLGMRADDDGFVNSPRKILRMSGCSDDDIKVLIAKKFVIPFDSGVVVIKHWKINNFIRNDRYNETTYKNEKAILELDENNSYRLTAGIPDDNQRYTQDRLGKDRLGKDNNLKGYMSVETPDKDKQTVPYSEIIEFYNSHRRAMSEAKTLADSRKKTLNARYKDYGLETIKQVILYAEESNFLNGGGNKGWIAGGLDWIMGPVNFPKILEGKYANKEINNQDKPGTWAQTPKPTPKREVILE